MPNTPCQSAFGSKSFAAGKVFDLSDSVTPKQNGWITPPADENPSLPSSGKDILVRLGFAALQGLILWTAFQIYKVARREFIPPDAKVAFDNALDVIDFQTGLGLMFELQWQQWALNQGDWYIKFFNNVYAYYMWWVIGGMMLVAFLAPARFRYIRRAFYISMLLVTPMYLLYPLAPPRFMQDHGWAFVDTLAVYGPNYFDDTGAVVQANRYAAMPSMHVGWTTFVAVAVSLLFASPKVRFIFVAAIALLMSYVVIITGNHWWIDGVVGWIFIGSAFVVNRFIPYPLSKQWFRNQSSPDEADARQSNS